MLNHIFAQVHLADFHLGGDGLGHRLHCLCIFVSFKGFALLNRNLNNFVHHRFVADEDKVAWIKNIGSLEVEDESL